MTQENAGFCSYTSYKTHWNRESIEPIFQQWNCLILVICLNISKALTLMPDVHQIWKLCTGTMNTGKFNQERLLFPSLTHKAQAIYKYTALFLLVSALLSLAEANVWVNKNFTNVIAGSVHISISSYHASQPTKYIVLRAHKQKLWSYKGVTVHKS